MPATKQCAQCGKSSIVEDEKEGKEVSAFLQKAGNLKATKAVLFQSWHAMRALLLS